MPGHALFQWMLRNAAWSHNRFQLQSHRGGTPWEIKTGTCYKSPLLPLMEACMIRVPIDLPGAVKTMLKAMPAAKVPAFLTSMADAAKS